MRPEELIAALARSDIDREAGAEIVGILTEKLLENYPQSKDYFMVLETCKEDIIRVFGDLSEMVQRINKLSDNQMEEIATDVGDQLIGPYWIALKLAAEAELEGEQ